MVLAKLNISIIFLVRRLISTLESSLHDLHQHEQASSASYDKEVQDLASEKEQLEESRAALSDELTELQVHFIIIFIIE